MCLLLPSLGTAMTTRESGRDGAQVYMEDIESTPPQRISRGLLVFTFTYLLKPHHITV